MNRINSKTHCWRCEHPYAWHRPLDTNDLDPIQPTGFRCYGHDPDEGGSRRGCRLDCPQVDPEWVPPLAPREPTQVERGIARLWVDLHTFTDPAEREAEYESALSVLVFANARPARREST